MRNSHIQVFSQVHLVRLAVLRLINHYGYDVVNYDCDAIPLKNLGPVFNKYKDADIVGTFGKGPSILYEKWGVTLNVGVMLLQSNSRTGNYYCCYPWARNHTYNDYQSSTSGANAFVWWPWWEK